MVNQNNFFNIFKKIFEQLSPRRKFVIIIFCFLSIISAFTEVASISILIPFADVLLDPQRINFYLSKLDMEIILNIDNLNYYTLSITLAFISIIIISSLMKFILGYLGHIIAFNVTHEMNFRLFKSVLFSDTILEQKNDENNINSSIIKMHSITVILQQILSVVANTLILLFIFLLMLNILDSYLIFSLLGLALFYILIAKIFKKIINRNSQYLSESIDKRTAILNNTIGLFKIIKTNYLEKFFLNNFIKEDYRIAKRSIISSVLVSSPAILITSLTIVALAIFIYSLRLDGEDLTNKIPILTALAYSIQKIMPLMQNLYSANIKIRGNYYQAASNLKLIKKIKYPLQNNKKNFSIKKFVKYENIYFSYKNKKILEGLNLELQRGDRILISGKSGVGKTTLVNILLGMLKPDRGRVKIDKKLISSKKFSQLRNLFSYISQDIYIFKGSFLENVSLNDNQKKINFEKIIKITKITKIFDIIKRSKNKFNTIISHRARNISGGQMQRIGMARGLYKDADVYIFEESTNAIDKNTENKILKNLKKDYPDKIFIFISHKVLNKDFFNKKYTLINKRLIKKKEW